MITKTRGVSSSIHHPALLFLGLLGITFLYMIPSLACADTQETIRFTHPTRVFSISIPKSWGSGTPFPADPNVFTFCPPGGYQFTISITQNLNLPAEYPMEAVTFMFPDETPITQPTREKGNGWNSIRQDFEKETKNKTWVWFAKFYGFKSNAIAITLNDTKENIEKYREAFEAITKSIQFSDKP
jgi:hypothetical protein